MRKLNLPQGIACLALCLMSFGLSVQSVQAQIVLNPSQNYLRSDSDSVQSSRREKPVSKKTPPVFPPGHFSERSLPSAATEEPPASFADRANNSRDDEYALIAAEANALQRQLNLVRRIVKFAGPCIVHIEATKQADPGKGFASSRIEEAGAGVIIDIDGSPHVITNRHVIYPAELSSIRLETNGGRQLTPTNVWTDPNTDVAVIRLAEQDLLTAQLGNSNATEVGDFVLAVGSPFGLSHSVTYGIISAKGRRNLELGSKEIVIQDFFQTDAAINPGNSGGPLLNLRGEIVGINTAIASNSGGNEGIGFSIPINMAVLVAEQLVTRGQLNRAYLGVTLENVFTPAAARRLGLSSNTGALVKEVIINSPAEQAGLQVGDVIVAFNGKAIQNDGHLVQTVGLTPIARQVRVEFYRQGRRMSLFATLAPNPDY